jgi:chorismate mutase-like protein
MKKHSIALATLCILFASALFQIPANAATHSQLQNADKLYSLLERRVDLMKWVAMDKWKNNKPIEDLPREKIVLQETRKQAADAGILYIDDLTRAQITIAKNEQRRWMGKWNKHGLPKNQTGPTLSELRNQLDNLSNELISSLQETLPSLRDDKIQPHLHAMLNDELKRLPMNERNMLWKALLKLRRAPQ